MATKKHREGWITGTEPATAHPCPDTIIPPLLLVLPKTFHLSPWSEPHSHTSSPLCSAGILHLCLICQPLGEASSGAGKYQAQNQHLGNCQLHPVATDILQPLGVEPMWPLSSTLPPPLPPCQHQGCTNCSQTDLGGEVALGAQSQRTSPPAIPLLETSQRMSQQVEEPGPVAPFP